MLAALYLRISREDEEKDKDCFSESIENQRMLLRDYAKKNGIAVIGEYVDEDCSGLTDQRPDFQKMIADAKMGKFGMILAKDQSRFSRNMQHVEKYLHREFRQYGIRFVGVTDGTDTADKTNKKARQIYGLVNEWYSEDLSESVRAVLHRKVREGQFIGSAAPYGYKKQLEDPHRLCEDEEKSKVVREIFELYVLGNSLRGICRVLNQREIKTPGGKTQWNPVTVRRILTNEVYLGHLLQGKSTNRSYKDPHRIYFENQNWVKHENMHKPLIAEETFRKVQERMRKNV